MYQQINGVATCPGNTVFLSLTQWLLGQSPALPMTPTRNKQQEMNMSAIFSQIFFLMCMSSSGVSNPSPQGPQSCQDFCGTVKAFCLVWPRTQEDCDPWGLWKRSSNILLLADGRGHFSCKKDITQQEGVQLQVPLAVNHQPYITTRFISLCFKRTV